MYSLFTIITASDDDNENNVDSVCHVQTDYNEYTVYIGNKKNNIYSIYTKHITDMNKMFLFSLL